MLKSALLVAAAIALTLPATAAAQEHQPAATSQTMQTRPNPGQYTLTFTLSCICFQVDSLAPSIQFTNEGPGIVPAGTKLHWVVKQSNGDYVVPGPIAVHQITVLNGVARSGVGGCTITVVH